MAKIIIIDDDAQMRRMVGRILTGAGHDVREAENGCDGLAAIRAQKPDLVITDVLMPEKDGIETIRELRTADGKIPILVFSGGGQISNKAMFLDMAKEFGASASLEKPFRAAELLETVARLLSPRPTVASYGGAAAN